MAITLGSVGDVRDVFEIKEDGSAVYTQNTFEKVITSNDNISLSSSGENYIRFLITTNNPKIISTEKTIYSNLFQSKSYSEYSPNNYECVVVHISGSILLEVLKSKLTTSDVVGFKAWLQTNPITVRYQLATPIITHIPKELCPVILTQATNTFQFGDAVAPYSVTIKAPTTDDIAKSYENIVLLNGYTQTVGTAKPVVNLINTGLVRLQMDLTAPSTGMNATIFTLPSELRPVTTQKIPVFVNGVSQLATIDKTTGNVNLASVPSASANVYIKTDYRRDI